MGYAKIFVYSFIGAQYYVSFCAAAAHNHKFSFDFFGRRVHNGSGTDCPHISKPK